MVTKKRGGVGRGEQPEWGVWVEGRSPSVEEAGCRGMEGEKEKAKEASRPGSRGGG